MTGKYDRQFYIFTLPRGGGGGGGGGLWNFGNMSFSYFSTVSLHFYVTSFTVKTETPISFFHNMGHKWPKHPGIDPCKKSGSDGQVCGADRHCFRGNCRHICGTPDRACVCQPNSKFGNFECHKCCISDTGTCTSIYDGLSPLLAPTFGHCLQLHVRQCHFDCTDQSIQVVFIQVWNL